MVRALEILLMIMMLTGSYLWFRDKVRNNEERRDSNAEKLLLMDRIRELKKYIDENI